MIHAPPRPELDARQLFFPILLGSALFVFFLRLWYLQVVEANELRDRAETTSTISVEQPAPRGRIVDRKGKVLASVKPKIVVTAVPNEALAHPEAVAKVAKMLGKPPEDLVKAIQDAAWRRYLPSAVYVGASLEVASIIEESPYDYPGFRAQTQPMRSLQDPISLSHVLGWVWTSSDTDVARLEKEGIAPAMYVGKNGVERTYEKDLMGAAGAETMQVDARRRPVRSIVVDAPTPGRELVLGLDADLQRLAMNVLAEAKKPGAVVALDPRNGEILALASSPSFDPNLFVGGISSKDYARLQADPGKPLFNRTIGGAYQPGSTFKLVTSIAAQLAGAWRPNKTVFCPGYLKLGNATFKCLGRHGSIDYETALERSCNTYFGQLALDAGVDNMRKACALIGLGEKTGIDITGESKGVVPTKAWVAKNVPDGRWYPGNTVHFGIGQGYLALTPIQAASLAAFVAEKGVSYKPHLVREVRDRRTGQTRTIEPEVLGRMQTSDLFWHSLRDGMRRVIDSPRGTAHRAASIAGLEWAGKTGSAEHRRRAVTHSWFVGFAPLDDPRIAIAVVVEQAGHGSEVAAPIARKVVQQYLRPKAEKPAPPPKPLAKSR